MDVLILLTASEFLWANQGVIKCILTCSYSAEIFLYLTGKSLWPALEGTGPWSPWVAGEVLMAVFCKHRIFSTSHLPCPPYSPKYVICKRKPQLQGQTFKFQGAASECCWVDQIVFEKCCRSLRSIQQIGDQADLWHPQKSRECWRSKVWVIGWGS